MRRSVYGVGAVTAVALPVLSACGGGTAQGGEPGYSAARLSGALLSSVQGYQRPNAPQAGAYGKLPPIQNFKLLQRQVTLNKPNCANVGGTVSPDEFATDPAAVVGFSGPQGQTLSETVLAVPAAQAAQQVAVRVPTGCRTFRAQVAGQWSTHTVTEVDGTKLGEGSRTVGVSTVAGTSRAQTWYVVVQGENYLVTVTLYGPNAAQSEAEGLATLAYDHARQALS